MKQILNKALLVSCYHAILGNVQNLGNYTQYLRNPSIFCNVSQNTVNGKYYLHAPDFDNSSVYTHVCSVQELREYINSINNINLDKNSPINICAISIGYDISNMQNYNQNFDYINTDYLVIQSIDNNSYIIAEPENGLHNYICTLNELISFINFIRVDDGIKPYEEIEETTKAFFIPSVNQKFTCNAAGDEVILVCLYSSDSHIICKLADDPLSYEIHYDEFKSNGFVFTPVLSNSEKAFKAFKDAFKLCSDLGINVCHKSEDEISEKTFYFSSVFYTPKDNTINLV